VAVGAVEADAQLGPHLVKNGDVVIAIGSSGLHSNGFSLVRHILAKNDIGYTDTSAELGGVVGEILLEPTRLYTSPLLRLLSDQQVGASVHAFSHITGGGIAANIARVLPIGSWAELDRATWSPAPVFRVLADLGGMDLTDTEGTWNLGIGMIAVVDAASANAVIEKLGTDGLPAWIAGTVSTAERPSARAGSETFEQGAKGVNGGAVRLIGAYRN
jgi:phosphoribosylformylglycinamidine cyclo-ligase